MFAERMKHISASGIRKVFELSAQLEDPINFSIGQPDFEVPDSIKQKTIEAIQAGKNSYTVTQGIPELRDEISTYIEKTKGIKPEHNFVTGGVSGGILLSLLVLVNPGDEVILPDPYFVMYRNLVYLAGGIPKYYDLYPDFELQPQRIAELVTPKTKIILLNSPSNPTGVVFSEESLKEVAKIARDNDLIFISDEIYSQFVYQQTYPSIFTYYPEKTILLDGFSKAYGMTGWRMGYAAGPHDIIDKMLTLQQFSFVCAPSMAQNGCIGIFDVDMGKEIKEYQQKRDTIYNGLREHGYEVAKPDGSFYIFPKVPRGTDKEFCAAAFEHNMLIIPGSAFSARDTHFRISFAVSDEKLQQGLDVLGKLAKQNG